MGRGRPRKPLKLHTEEGTYVPCRHGLRSDPEATGELAMPDGLDDDEQRYWRRVVPTIEKLGVAGEQDIEALKMLCRAGVAFEWCYAAWQADMADTRLRTSAIQWLEQWRKLASDFGLSPVARTKLQVKPKEDADDAEKRFFG